MSEFSRRHFLSSVGTAAVVSGSLLADEPNPGKVMKTEGPVSQRPLPENLETKSRRYRPSSRFGLGGVAIGNGFAPTTDQDANRTLESAWNAGVRYFDTSPFYGFGLSERRFGHFLDDHSPDDYVLSTKVGRVFTATSEPPQAGIWKDPSSFKYQYDYSAAGVRRSIEDSLQRLGVSQIDIVFIHDLNEGNGDLGKDWTKYFDQAVKGAMPELCKMRDEGIIKAWGLGVNQPEPALRASRESDPDIHLLATQYSLMDHEKALHTTFPKLEEKGISVVVGAPLNAGYLAGRDRYHYDGKIPDWAPQKRSRIQKIAHQHGVDLRTAALQFCLGPKVVSAVIPGARNASQTEADVQSMKIDIPDGFWSDLKREGLIAKGAPVPKLVAS
ncbi:aldo/keto reductase [Bremerella alba]|uniref:D-threo-aldose 1-dehydrogenase n=1 Tax=Bremerella alba TaxID=980252 RepID=A0A7V8V484_9BACT|nr:aldo/keto reductase [Bremerella alba]MBA2114657.1 D-threo-aldose 1-dehydrogenase [Bremerella alba]